MADEYIRRQDAIDAFNRIKDTLKNPETAHYDTLMFYEIEDVLEDVEPTDVVPVVHAYWIPQKENHEFKEAWMKCSACGYPVSRWTGNTNFCPNCGARMEEYNG